MCSAPPCPSALLRSAAEGRKGSQLSLPKAVTAPTRPGLAEALTAKAFLGVLNVVDFRDVLKSLFVVFKPGHFLVLPRAYKNLVTASTRVTVETRQGPTCGGVALRVISLLLLTPRGDLGEAEVLRKQKSPKSQLKSAFEVHFT